ncbi:enolase (2-phosphoglycerate dehydratase; 2-phospho-D-glycerate hydro-lyase) [Campylobacter sputorum subsp. bubulus]|uniref:Enolase (2-phosphoglycerate dehydratase 2-phospho-D-glycerate hydro-lyase) n=1 Tax=Campylobacter sputorum subsp. sputorum TaxID=32024 RepID=A0A381DLF9_9BACT|nr:MULTISPECIES: ferritin family protein [Campylobacter]ASM34858.1 desulforubrerythrin [Campylobacter sputorum aubsp. sputorum RM3237]ASM36520.1 desulforubrerythrin [Campylobacter sputorum bv. faecalis CCUG 20703]ASM38219.1 desulforubrerythrin [Campylobacter sputorum bv. paraureolyticus LMG 11764]KAB0582008.1 rubrerythrin family protein [Campylobacter sputorum subsp. sputorum]MBE7357491.1 rubrerythrin family protein [Campylobacter sp. RM11302]
MRQYETYRCPKCGNVIEIQEVGGGSLTCCGVEMELVTKDLTSVNLMKAFAGESMARNKYDLYGDIAKEAGYHAIARHFYEAAENEKWHARAEYKKYNEIQGLPLDKMDKNLISAADGERYEHTTMYPDFAKIAEDEGKKDIARLFNAIAKVEVEHEREYLELKKMLEADGFFQSDEEDVWVCEVCGHVHRGKKAPGACPLCKAPKEYFKREFLG